MHTLPPPRHDRRVVADSSSDLVLVWTFDLETAEKIRRVCKKNVVRCFTPCLGSAVPDSPDIDKTVLGIRLERTLKRRVQRAARQSTPPKTASDFVREILIRETSHVTLTSKDYEKIAEEVRRAEAKKGA